MTTSQANPTLIIGGAGFIGCNLAHHLAREGRRVRIYDNLSRDGVERNVEFLKHEHGDRVEVRIADVRDGRELRNAIQDASAVFHLAAQVAVTHALRAPRHDLEVNLHGTFDVLEALRALPTPPPMVFTSTNKVYGCLPDIELIQSHNRWWPENASLAATGLSEDRALQFRSPYGCSKGSADQYVLDYAATYGLPATVFRMSCIYGPHQCGTEDQGWVAHFLMQARDGRPVTIYGDGKQVRDILYVDDLVQALVLARERIDATRGRAFNIGGGPECTVSLLELLTYIETMRGSPLQVEWADWRPSDQRYYVSNTRRFGQATGWRPRVSVTSGLRKLHEWLMQQRGPANHNGVSPRSVAKGA